MTSSAIDTTVATPTDIAGQCFSVSSTARDVQNWSFGLLPHVRSKVVRPSTKADSGKSTISTQSENCGRAAYHRTMRLAVRAGSDPGGGTWRRNNAAMKRTAGMTRAKAQAATTSLVRVMND